MAINPHPVDYRNGNPLYEQEYTDLEDVVTDAINANFDLEDGDADPIDIASKILDAVFAKYDVVTATPPKQ